MEAATWGCTVTSSGNPCPLAGEPQDVLLSVWEGALLPSDPVLLDGRGSLPKAKVLLWEVRAVAVSAPMGTVVTFALKELFLPPAPTIPV